MKTQICVLACAAVAAVGLAFAVGRTPEAAQPQRGGQDFLSVVFGDARTVIGSALYHKADSYFHGGVDMDGGHDCALHGGHDDHQGHDHHDHAETTSNGASFDPWRWINAHIQAPQVERHLEGRQIGELVPILWASVKADPKNEEAWTTAWYVAAVMMKDDELGFRILSEGLKENPESAELRFFHARAILNGGKGDKLQARIELMKVRDMLLERCARDESRLSAANKETLEHTRMFLEALSR